MSGPEVKPAPGPFVYLKVVDSRNDGIPVYKQLMLSNEQAIQLADQLVRAASYCEDGEFQHEVRTPFHGKPNEPITFRESPKV